MKPKDSKVKKPICEKDHLMLLCKYIKIISILMLYKRKKISPSLYLFYI